MANKMANVVPLTSLHFLYVQAVEWSRFLIISNTHTPNSIIRNTMEVAPNWILIIAITLSYSYIDRLVRRSQRERRQRQIDETQDSGSVLGGGGPTLD